MRMGLGMGFSRYTAVASAGTGLSPPAITSANLVELFDADVGWDSTGTGGIYSTQWAGQIAGHVASVQSISGDNNPVRTVDADGYTYFTAGSGGNTQAAFRSMSPTGTLYHDYIAVIRSNGAPASGAERLAANNAAVTVEVEAGNVWDASAPGAIYLSTDPTTDVDGTSKTDGDFIIIRYSRDGGADATIGRLLEAGNSTMWGQDAAHDAGLYWIGFYDAQISDADFAVIANWLQDTKYVNKFSPSSSVVAASQGDGTFIFETTAEGDHEIELLSGMRGAGTVAIITDADMTSQLNLVEEPGWTGDETTVGATLTAEPAIYATSTDLTEAEPLYTMEWQEGGFTVSSTETYIVSTEATYRGLEIIQSTVNPDPLSTTEFLTATTTVIAGQTPRLSFDGANHSISMMSTSTDVYDYCYAFSVTPSTEGRVIGNGNPDIDFRSGDELRFLARFIDNSTDIFTAADDVAGIALNQRHSFIVSMSTSNAVTDGGSNFVLWHHSLGKIMEKTMAALGDPDQSLRFNARLGGPNSDSQQAAFNLEGGGFWGMVGKSINVDQEASNIFNGDGTWNADLVASNGRFESAETPGVFFDPNNDTALTVGVSVHGWEPSFQALVDSGQISINEGLPVDAPT